MHIRTSNTFKYKQNTFKYINWYLYVYASICMYMTVYACIFYQQVAGVNAQLCVWSVCMYLHVFACILTVYNSRQWIQQHSTVKLYCSGQYIYKSTQGHRFWQKTFLMCIYLHVFVQYILVLHQKHTSQVPWSCTVAENISTRVHRDTLCPV